MLNWRDLLPKSNTELARLDIAAVNLACTAGLPGADVIDIPGCLQTVDAWAGVVRRWTDAAYLQSFLTDPAKYDHSEPLFRMVSMHTALHRHCGVRYNPDKIHAKLIDPFDLDEQFIYGVIQGPGGTCATLPVVYTAVGRRLGYPVRLVEAKGHLFCRWDDPATGERVNLDGGSGPNVYPDDHYRNWPAPMSAHEERWGGYLLSLTPQQELALFVANRGYVWQDCKEYRRAVLAFAESARLAGEYARYPSCVRRAVGLWWDHLQSRKPPGFPRVEVKVPDKVRRWPRMPPELEMKIELLGATEELLDSPVEEQMFWEPMRAGRLHPSRIPTTITVTRTGKDPCMTQAPADG